MKYLRTFLLALEREFISRINLLGWIITGSTPSLILVIVWFAILGNRENVSGFTKGDFIIYYLYTNISWYIVGGKFGQNLGKDIKNGLINTNLLKPYNIVLGKALEEQAWKVISLSLAVPFTLLILFICKELIHIEMTYHQILLLFLSLVLGGLNFAFIEAIIGSTAFWVIEIWPIDHIVNILLTLFGGLLVPITLMPPLLLSLANILPFKYMFYVPVSILLNKNSIPYMDIFIQLIYIFILYGIYKYLWWLGVKKYEAIGS